MSNQEKLDAVKRLSKIGSHAIIAFETANEIGKPFGIEYQGDTEFKADGNPKGVIADCKGIDIHGLASAIVSSVIDTDEVRDVVKRGSFFGRGTQFRDDIQKSILVLENTNDDGTHKLIREETFNPATGITVTTTNKMTGEVTVK